MNLPPLLKKSSDQLFAACVELLERSAEKTGLTYEEINVLVFCVIWPAVTLGMAAYIAIDLLKE